MSWWQHGVLYQIYPRSFADSDGDGVGDLRGVISRLDYLEWLGVDGIWLNPTMPSPNDDWGYDVADYCAVHPELGTLEDLDALIEEAGRRGIRVLLDLVPNHTSDRHPWFADALAGRDARYRDFYVWADPEPDGTPPNNWQSLIRRPGVDARRGLRPVLPAQLPAEPAGPQLVERARFARSSTRSCASGSRAGSPASGSTSATRSSTTATCATIRPPARTIIR